MKCSCHMQDVQRNQQGHVSWFHENGDHYRVSGKLTNGTRFRGFLCETWSHANGINLWNGTVMLKREFDRTKHICPNNRSADDHTMFKTLKRVSN